MVAHDDTPTLWEMLTQGACLACGAEPGCNIDCQLCLIISAWKPQPVAPDDTPTRLLDTIADELHDRWVGGENPDVTYPDFLVAEVSRLREALAEEQYSRRSKSDEIFTLSEQLKAERQERLIWSNESKMLTREKQQAEADVSRLQQELQRKDDQLIGSQRVKEDYKHLTEELRKSQEENALLRRSLEMLTKQMDELQRDLLEAQSGYL